MDEPTEADMRRALLAVIVAALLLMIAGVAVATGSYVVPCTANTETCQNRRLAALESAVSSLTRPTTTVTATPTPTPTTAGQCQAPYAAVLTGKTDTWDAGDNRQVVNNNMWGSQTGTQTTNVCGPASWTAVANQPNHAGAIQTYPDTEYFVGGQGPNGSASTKPISAYVTIGSTFAEAFGHVSGDEWDAAYDLWTNQWTDETMIWNEWTNPYYPTACTQVTLGGVGYCVSHSTGYTVFWRDAQVKSGSVDILAAYQYEVSRGWALASDVPTQLEYGVEIAGTVGTQSFPVTGLSFTLG